MSNKEHLMLLSDNTVLSDNTAYREITTSAEESVWAAALASLGDAIVITDVMGRIRWMNPAAAVLTGWTWPGAAGKELTEVLNVVDEKTGRPIRDLAVRVIRKGIPFDFSSSHELARADGTKVPINGNVTPMRDRTKAVVGAVAVFRDISDRKRVERELRALLEKFRIIFENASDGINIYEEDIQHGTRRLIDCNERYAEMAGRPKEELLSIGNTTLLQRKVGNVIPALDNITLRRQHIPYRGLISWNRPDGKENIVEYAAVPIEIDGRPCTIGLDRDITERVKLQEALEQRTRELEALTETLRQQADELQRQNDELDAFAHMVAHDLKNPLTIILGVVELLDEIETTHPSSERKEFLQTARHHAQKMHKIINGLLELAEARKKEITCGPLDMSLLVQEALEQLAPLIESRQAEIILPASWPVAMGYAPWVEQVWVNYISNAIKYGGNPPRVELGATALDDGMVRFWVRDNGPGITPEEQARLFTPFTRLGQVPARGHGLGLTIVQRIVHRLGGTVSVESTPGCGSTFGFTLPGTMSAAA